MTRYTLFILALLAFLTGWYLFKPPGFSILNQGDNGIFHIVLRELIGDSSISGESKEDTSTQSPTHLPTNIETIDFEKDDAYTKFVSQEKAYENINYTPTDLTGILSSGSLVSSKEILLRIEAYSGLILLSRDFASVFSTPIVVVSGYRSHDYQLGIEENSPECIKNNYCARAGHSEHQSGLAVDLFETTNKETFLSKENLKVYFEWLQQNAYKYGYINSYSKGVEIDGYHEEPWHWRYVGVALATRLHEEGMNLTEYYRNMK